MTFDWTTLLGPVDRMRPDRRLAPAVTVDPEDWAHGAWTALAVTLAEPLRQALRAHHATCSTCKSLGLSHCFEGSALWDLLPDGDRIVYA